MKIKWSILFAFTALISLTSVVVVARQTDQPRSKDDLAGWIYSQIQYAAAHPLNRADILTRTEIEVWRQPKTPQEVQAWLDLLANMGYAWLLNGNIVRSTDSYTSAFDWARRHADLVDPAQVLDNILKPLGNNYTRLGDYEQALYIHGKALAVAKALDDPDALAGTYSNLANTASNMGEPERSIDYCRLGLAIARVSPAIRGLLLAEQADAFLQTGNQQGAMSSIRSSISLLETTKNPFLSTAYQQAGDIYAATPDIAVSYYRKALAIAAAGSSVREKAKLCQRFCRLYTNTGDTANANQWLNSCLALLVPNHPIGKLQRNDLIAENTLADLLFTGAILAAKQGQPEEALRRYRLSFATETTLRSEYISGSAKLLSVATVHDRYESAIATAYQAWQATRQETYRQSLLDFIEGSRAQLLLDDLTRARQSRSASAHDSIGNRIRLLEQAIIYYRKESLQHPVPQLQETEWQLAQLRKKHAPRTVEDQPRPRIPYTTRSWFAGRDTLYTVEAENGQISFVDRQPMPVNLRGFTDRWFGAGAGPMLNDPEAYYDDAYAIYKAVIAPHPLQSGKTYIFLPDGALEGLPFDALPAKQEHVVSPTGWPYLIKVAAISYAYSLETLAASLHDPGQGKGFAGFFLSGNSRHLPLLHAMQQEQQGIATIVPKGEWYADGKGTTRAFARSLERSSVIHISSHAFSGRDTTTIPRIELYDAPYYIFELRDLAPGQHPDLVVLDACRTGDGRMVAGEGAQSLARAFAAGGVNAVVSGWWNVNDQTAAALMQQFYGQLMTDEADAAGALRKAKLAWLSDTKLSYQQKLPYYWAALNYTGDRSPKLHLESRNFAMMKWWEISVAGLVLALLLFKLLQLPLSRTRSKIVIHGKEK